MMGGGGGGGGEGGGKRGSKLKEGVEEGRDGSKQQERLRKVLGMEKEGAKSRYGARREWRKDGCMRQREEKEGGIG